MFMEQGCCVDVECYEELVTEARLCVLQPPFNVEARAAAGFGPEWYLPLAA